MADNSEFYNSERAQEYYSAAEEANRIFTSTPEYSKIVSQISSDMNIIEFGCWEGSKIASFRSSGANLYWIDISKRWIEMAKENYPYVHFLTGDFSEADTFGMKFNVALSFFVIEHVDDPEHLIRSMINILAPGWKIILWFPNYGSPLFPSPPTLYKKSILEKMKCIFKRIITPPSQYFQSVLPIRHEYQSDFDTVSEIRMKLFLDCITKKYGLRVVYSDSGWWNLGTNPLFILYKPFRFLSRFWLFSFVWPQCFCILELCQN